MNDPRSHFPALRDGFAFLDNAAGAQVPQHCIDGISRFLSSASCNIELPYPGSQLATEVKQRARAETAEFFNCLPHEVVFGTSATSITFLLSDAFARLWGAGDEVIVSELEHETNTAPWHNLAERGVKIKTWRARWPEGTLHLDDLHELVTPCTKLLAITSASNALGTMPDVSAATEIAHAVGAWVITDLVAYAPHVLPDVRRTNVDFAFFSCYKIFGPHTSFLYVRQGLLERLPMNKFPFAPEGEALKFERGTLSHELLAGWLGTLEYLRELGRSNQAGRTLGNVQGNREALAAAYRHSHALEQPLVEFTLERLSAMPNIELYGLRGVAGRLGTFLFNVKGQAPLMVAERLAQAGIGIGAGDYYAMQPLRALGLLPDGALRASLLHYNTREDLERLLEALDQDYSGLGMK
jgi:cysteine desulfurase family protein (TIGR01976 family)